MSKRLQVNDSTALAFGFVWQALDAVESKSTKLAELLSQGHKWQASFKRNRVEYLGASQEDFSPLPRIKTLSGAALMANHPKLAGQTVLIVMEEPVAPELLESESGGGAKAGEVVRSEMVVVGLLNGNIVIDDYVSKDDYQKQRAAFVDRCSKAKAKYISVGTSYTLGPVSQVFTWEDFLPTKGNKAVPVRTLEPNVYARVLWGALAVAAVSGIGWGYVAWDNEQKEAAERARRAREARNLPAMYTESVDTILNKPILRANSVFADLREKIRYLPLRMAGWDLKKIECTSETAACTAIWENRSKTGTNRAFAAAAPSTWGTVNFDPSGESLSHSLPFKLATAKLPPREAWPSSRDFLLKQFSQWQSYWVVGFHPSLESPAHVMGLVPGLDEQSAAELPDVVWASSWSISKTDWHLSEGFDRSAEKGDSNLPDSVTVDTISLELDQNRQLKFDAKGKIYERR